MIDLHPELSRVLLEDLPVGLAFIDRDERVIWANEAFAAFIGSTVTTVVGECLRALPVPLPSQTRTDNHDAEVLVETSGAQVFIWRRLGSVQFEGHLLMVTNRGYPHVELLTERDALALEGVLGTGVLSRDAAQQRLGIEISRSRRYDNPLSCIVAGVNLPPVVTASPAQRAQALQSLTRILSEHLRWVDVVGLWESDRLLIVLPETTAEAATLLQRKLARAVARNWPRTLSKLGVQWGMSTWRRGDDIRRLVARAEPPPPESLAPAFSRVQG